MSKELNEIAHQIRLTTFRAIAHAGGGHFGGCLSIADILAVLYFKVMRIDPELWADLERLAATELRSVNGQIEYLLREALSGRNGKLPAPQSSQQRTVRTPRRASGAD